VKELSYAGKVALVCIALHRCEDKNGDVVEAHVWGYIFRRVTAIEFEQILTCLCDDFVVSKWRDPRTGLPMLHLNHIVTITSGGDEDE
jgi:hypothetical protein